MPARRSARWLGRFPALDLTHQDDGPVLDDADIGGFAGEVAQQRQRRGQHGLPLSIGQAYRKGLLPHEPQRIARIEMHEMAGLQRGQQPMRRRWRQPGLLHEIGQPQARAILCQGLERAASWSWLGEWSGWFADSATCESKQDAADAATEAWWKWVQTDIPRDTDTEIAVIAARVLVMPPPNHLNTESAAYLRKLIGTLRIQCEAELRADSVPRPAADLIANLSAELYRRRLAGKGAAAGCGTAASVLFADPAALRLWTS